MQRLSPYDHLVRMFETDTSPMNIAGLLVFDVPESEWPSFAGRVREVLEDRVPRTLLAQRQIEAPEDFDAPAWFRIDPATAISQIRTCQFAEPLDRQGLIDHVVRRSLEHIDITTAGFAIDIIGPVAGWGCAIYLKHHHSLADGIGFQRILAALTDEGAVGLGPFLQGAEAVPSDEAWLAASRERFEREAPDRAAEAQRKAEAELDYATFLADPAHQRVAMPIPAFGSVTGPERAYRPVPVELERLKAVGRRIGASVNDVFMAVASGALRSYLLERDLLPDAPLIGQCVRSFRRPEHGDWGNRVNTMFPEIATDEADPLARLNRIRANMTIEKRRAEIEEHFVAEFDTLYGARDRKAALSDIAGKQATIGLSNVVLSNVPGPAQPPHLAGYRLIGNFPVPILGPGLFLNITLRRNGPSLDMGVMADPGKITDIDAFAAAIENALLELEAAS